MLTDPHGVRTIVIWRSRHVNSGTPMGEVEGIGGRIKARRNELRLTQKALADELGVDQPRVVKWEGGAVPETAVLPRLATVLQCSTDYLLGRPPAEDEWRLQNVRSALEAPYPTTKPASDAAASTSSGAEPPATIARAQKAVGEARVGAAAEKGRRKKTKSD